MKIGDVVISVCGNDIGEWYIVKNVANNFVYLIDGKTKTIQKPKKKNKKHVASVNLFDSNIANKIAQGAYLQDAEVRKTLKFFKNNY